MCTFETKKTEIRIYKCVLYAKHKNKILTCKKKNKHKNLKLNINKHENEHILN